MARPASDIPERLLAAARSHFLAQGVDGASLRAIARDAGTSIGMIYYHYETKDDLFREVVEQWYRPLLDDLVDAFDPTLPPEQRLANCFARFGKLTDEELEVVRIVIREGMTSSERLSIVMQRFSQGHLPLVVGAMVDGMSDGTIRDDLHPMALLLGAGSLALFAQVMRRRLPEDRLPMVPPPPEDLTAGLLEILLHGIAPRD